MLVLYFRTAAKLLRLSCDDLTLLPWVFVQTVVGLEKVLRLHYDADKKRHLGDLLQQAVSEGLFTDNAFECIPPLPKTLMKRMEKKEVASQAERLVILIPSLRNDIVHGDFHGFLFEDLLPLIVQTREIVDTVVLHLPRSLFEQMNP